MPESVVIELHALNSGSLLNSNGLILHSAWFAALAQGSAELVDRLHDQQVKPFTISPLMGLHADEKGICSFGAGQKAWFRVTILADELSESLAHWLESLGSGAILKLKETLWQVDRAAIHSDEHPWAGRMTYEHLMQVVQGSLVKGRWTLEFATPMTLNGSRFAYPFPQPESLVRSWLERWQVFAPVFLTDELPSQAREYLAVEDYRLHTETVRMHGMRLPGCLGRITLRERGMTPDMRLTLALLVEFAFFCGSGYKTTQGLGQTRVVRRE